MQCNGMTVKGEQCKNFCSNKYCHKHNKHNTHNKHYTHDLHGGYNTIDLIIKFSINKLINCPINFIKQQYLKGIFFKDENGKEINSVNIASSRCTVHDVNVYSKGNHIYEMHASIEILHGKKYLDDDELYLIKQYLITSVEEISYDGNDYVLNATLIE